MTPFGPLLLYRERVQALESFRRALDAYERDTDDSDDAVARAADRWGVPESELRESLRQRIDPAEVERRLGRKCGVPAPVTSATCTLPKGHDGDHAAPGCGW